MVTDKILNGELIKLRQIEESDCTEAYVNWLKDEEVNKFLETKWCEQTLDSVLHFVKSQRESDNTFLFAIIDKKSNGHIGNIKIGPIDFHYLHGDISYFIGNKDHWHKGIATDAIRLISEFGTTELKLHKLEAGTYEDAVGSRKALERNGFIQEGILKDHVYCDGKYMNVLLFGKMLGE